MKKKICVFGGSKSGKNSENLKSAKTVGQIIAENNFDIIFGGGENGIMGSVSETAIKYGSKTTGIIPNFLVKKGFKKVYQLKGGIINYLKNINVKSSLWNGECYVFDNRVSLKHKLELGTYIICSGCRKPVSKDEKKSKKYKTGISCPRCYDKLSSSQKERFAMRQKQILLAKKMGKKYFIKKEYY